MSANKSTACIYRTVPLFALLRNRSEGSQLPCCFYAKPESYYSVLFHELAHSTGHASRLNRKEVTDPIAFGSHDYSLEEMVAELTAAFLCAEAGIDNTVENSAAYIAEWHKVLSADPKLFWIAAGRAQKAADYILGRGKDENQDTHND